MKPAILIFIVFTSLILSSCGQYGALYLPKRTASSETPTTSNHS